MVDWHSWLRLMKGTLSCCDKACHAGLVLALYRHLQLTSQHSQRCSLRQWSGYFPSSRLAQSKVLTSVLPATSLLTLLRIGTRCPLVWSYLAARSPDDQLADEEVCLLAHRCLLAHLLCALVGSAISFAEVVGNLQARPAPRLLAFDPCFP